MIKQGFIRPATSGDAHAAAPLIVETGYETNEIAFGDLDNARKVLACMFARPNNVHSYELTTVYELEGKVAAILIGYTYEEERRTFWPSAAFLFKKVGFKMGGILRIQGMIGKIDAEAYYVHVLAVQPEHRGKGIGAYLMREAERLAVKKGRSKVSLLVEAKNRGAIRFYQREGYEIIEPRTDKILLKRRGFMGYVKMTKKLDDCRCG